MQPRAAGHGTRVEIRPTGRLDRAGYRICERDDFPIRGSSLLYPPMNLEDLKKALAEVKAEAEKRLREVASLETLRQVESQVVGKKGRMGELLASIGKLPKEQRGQVG